MNIKYIAYICLFIVAIAVSIPVKADWVSNLTKAVTKKAIQEGAKKVPDIGIKNIQEGSKNVVLIDNKLTAFIAAQKKILPIKNDDGVIISIDKNGTEIVIKVVTTIKEFSLLNRQDLLSNETISKIRSSTTEILCKELRERELWKDAINNNYKIINAYYDNFGKFITAFKADKEICSALLITFN